MGEAVARSGALDRPADQRRRRTGMLVLRAPGPAGELAREKYAVAGFAIGCVQ